MTESLKRVSMVLLALAITLGLSGVLTLGITNNAGATNTKKHCPDHSVTGWALDKVESASGNKTIEGVKFKWSGDPGKLVVTNKSDHKVKITWCAKGGKNFADDSKNTGKVLTTLESGEKAKVKFGTEISYFMVYSIEKVEEPEEPKYQLMFEKKWDGDEFDKTNVEVTFINKEGKTAKPGQIITGDDIFPGATVEGLQEEVDGLPENCSVVADDIQSVYVLFEDMLAERMNFLTAIADVPTNGEVKLYTDTITVTNTVECDEDDDPVTPVVPEGEAETPVTVAPAGTTTQVTATPTGAVDAGAGADLAASLAGLMASAGVVAAGVFMRKFSVISL